MKRAIVVLLSVALLAATVPGMAQAHEGHGGYYGHERHERHYGGFDLGLGVVAALIAIPLIAASSISAPHYAPPPASSYDYGPSNVEPVYSQPAYASPAYAQQYQAPVQQQANFWYYCRSADGYYPYVRQCPEGWQPVSPRPPGY